MELYQYIQQPKPAVPSNFTRYTELGRCYQDVLTNLPDGPLWLELFIIADKSSQELAQILEYVRNVGAKLIMDQYYGFIIEPIIDPTGCYGWSSIEQYQQERRWLVPHTDILLQSLKLLREKYDNKQIIWK